MPIDGQPDAERPIVLAIGLVSVIVESGREDSDWFPTRIERRPEDAKA